MVKYEELTLVERKLISLMNEYELDEDDIYRFTGFNFEDVKEKEDLNEVIRLLGLWYYGVEKYSI